MSDYLWLVGLGYHDRKPTNSFSFEDELNSNNQPGKKREADDGATLLSLITCERYLACINSTYKSPKLPRHHFKCNTSLPSPYHSFHWISDAAFSAPNPFTNFSTASAAS